MHRAYSASDRVELAGLLLNLVKGNNRYVAAFPNNSKTPKPYELVKNPLTPERFADSHLVGKTCLGCYTTNPVDDTVWFAVLDFDDHTEDGDGEEARYHARTAFAYIRDVDGLQPVLERSQSGKGAHVWLFFEEPIEAKRVRNYLKHVLKQVELTAEIYPRQDSIQHLQSRLGNMVRYPLWGESRFIDMQEEELDPLTLLAEIPRYRAADLPDIELADEIIRYGANGYDTEGLPARVLALLTDEPTSMLARRWTCDVGGMRSSASRSELVYAIASELVAYRVPTPEIEAAIKHWCQQQDYQRDDRWISMTVCNAYDTAGARERHKDPSSLMTQVLHRSVDVMAQGGIPCIPTGITALNDSIKGIALSEYGLVCGRPSNGKTAVAFEWAEAAADAGYAAEYISFEMSGIATTGRILPRLGYSAQDIENLPLAEIHGAIEDYQKSRKAAIYFKDCTDGEEDLAALVEHIEWSHQHRGVQFFVIDYLELIDSGGSSSYDSQDKINRTLARLTRRLNIAIIGLVQVNREWAKEGGRPGMHHLKFGGEQHADVILIGRWLCMEDPALNKLEYVIHVLKNKNRGIVVPDVAIHFDGPTQRFHTPPGYGHEEESSEDTTTSEDF